uniref:Uncharacterized protein n=1 Tax=Glossina pallidipes TaxID=7398 RepID=A0A1B0AGY2_GLOPL
MLLNPCLLYLLYSMLPVPNGPKPELCVPKPPKFWAVVVDAVPPNKPKLGALVAAVVPKPANVGDDVTAALPNPPNAEALDVLVPKVPNPPKVGTVVVAEPKFPKPPNVEVVVGAAGVPKPIDVCGPKPAPDEAAGAPNADDVPAPDVPKDEKNPLAVIFDVTNAMFKAKAASSILTFSRRTCRPHRDDVHMSLSNSIGPPFSSSSLVGRFSSLDEINIQY